MYYLHYCFCFFFFPQATNLSSSWNTTKFAMIKLNKIYLHTHKKKTEDMKIHSRVFIKWNAPHSIQYLCEKLCSLTKAGCIVFFFPNLFPLTHFTPKVPSVSEYNHLALATVKSESHTVRWQTFKVAEHIFPW